MRSQSAVMRSFFFIWMIALLVFSHPVRADAAGAQISENPNAGSPESAAKNLESEYYGSVVLIDPETGALGILAEPDDEKNGTAEKKAFTADLKQVIVTNSRNEELRFDQIQSGDWVTVYAETDNAGRQRVTEIWDDQRFEQD